MRPGTKQAQGPGLWRLNFISRALMADRLHRSRQPAALVSQLSPRSLSLTKPQLLHLTYTVLSIISQF